MSNPVNPLAALTTYAAKHILIAFDNTDAASAFTLPTTALGKCGDLVKDILCGTAIVVVNEMEDTSYALRDLTWSYDFFSSTSQNTTISAGNFTVADTRGNQFPSFLRRVAKKLGIPQTRITFYLVTIFVGHTIEGEAPVVETAPLIFSLSDSATGFRAGMVNFFTFNFSMLYNTTAQMPNFSRLDQFTLTNKEKNPSSEIPTADGGEAKIIPRGQEDSEKTPKRDARISKSVPMRTLKDIFLSFEADLKALRFEHRRQLQEFLSIIRPDIVKKIKIPKAKRIRAGESIPITFKVNLEDKYWDYPVDNLNLMTEQTETKQLSTGITSMTVPFGSNVIDTVNTLMKLSAKTADDVLDGKAFKTVMTAVTGCDGVITITINVMQYTIPFNKVGEKKDTGPDPKGTVNKLELIFLDGTSGLDINSLSFSSTATNDVTVLEEDSPDLNDDPLLFSSQREQITFERPANSGFGGLRIASSPNNYGLQSAIKGVMVDRLDHRYAIPQNTITIINMIGNPDLYSDLARNPLQVANIQPGKPKLYKFPEYYPMYITLKVRIGKTHNLDISGNDEEWWYHTYHYHLSGITNQIVSGKFTQILRLLSTDDAI